MGPPAIAVSYLPAPGSRSFNKRQSLMPVAQDSRQLILRAEFLCPARVLRSLEQDYLANGVAVLAPCNFHDVFQRAEALSARHTIPQGHRSFDILHVATALHLGAREFLTFDTNQRKLAAAEKLRVKP